MGWNDHQDDPNGYADRFQHLAPPQARFPSNACETPAEDDDTLEHEDAA